MASVNDAISTELCRLHYTLVNDAVTQLRKVGHGALLAKMDKWQAYRNIPVAQADRYLLGLRWQQSLYIDQVLLFRLRSAPLIFSAIADTLLWIML